MIARRGFVLPEVITTLALSGILAVALYSMVRTQTRLASQVIQRTSRAEALRVASIVVAAETRAIAPADIHAVGPDSLAIRAFRGTAVVCSIADGIVHARYHGMRQPDPDKDSILVADTDELFALSSVAAGTARCATEPERDVALRLTGAAPRPGTVLLVFETGTYHFSTRALRFRRGAEGRQPITDESLDDAATGFYPVASAFHARVVLHSPGIPASATEQAVIVFPALNP